MRRSQNIIPRPAAWVALLLGAMVFSAASEVAAQVHNPYLRRGGYTPQAVPVNPAAPSAFGQRTPGNLPSRVDSYQRPTVSPYLQMLRRDSRGGVFDYLTQVRPEMEMREAARQQARALEQLQQQTQLFQQQQQQQQFRDPGIVPPAHPLTGAAQGLRPTGHPATFGNTMGYFPGLP